MSNQPLQELLNSNRIVSSFVKDISFEAKVNELTSDKQVNMNQKVDHNIVDTDTPENKIIEFKVTATAQVEGGSEVLFIAEVSLFANVLLVDDENSIFAKLFLQGQALDNLYNQARRTISKLITSGGFPDYQLLFTSFEQLFISQNSEELEAATSSK